MHRRGFADVRVVEKAESREFIKDWLPGSGAEDFVVSANVTATKPSFGREFIKELKKEPESLAASAAAAFDASGASRRRRRGSAPRRGVRRRARRRRQVGGGTPRAAHGRGVCFRHRGHRGGRSRFVRQRTRRLGADKRREDTLRRARGRTSREFFGSRGAGAFRRHFILTFFSPRAPGPPVTDADVNCALFEAHAVASRCDVPARRLTFQDARNEKIHFTGIGYL